VRIPECGHWGLARTYEMDYDRFVFLSESSAASGRFHVAVIPLLVAADDWSAASLVGAQRCKSWRLRGHHVA